MLITYHVPNTVRARDVMMREKERKCRYNNPCSHEEISIIVDAW